MNEKQKKLRDAFVYECGFDPDDAGPPWYEKDCGKAFALYQAAKLLLSGEPEKSLRDYTLAELAQYLAEELRDYEALLDWKAPK